MIKFNMKIKFFMKISFLITFYINNQDMMIKNPTFCMKIMHVSQRPVFSKSKNSNLPSYGRRIPFWLTSSLLESRKDLPLVDFSTRTSGWIGPGTEEMKRNEEMKSPLLAGFWRADWKNSSESDENRKYSGNRESAETVVYQRNPRLFHYDPAVLIWRLGI